MLRKISSIYRVNGWYQNADSQNMQIADYKPDLGTKNQNVSKKLIKVNKQLIKVSKQLMKSKQTADKRSRQKADK